MGNVNKPKQEQKNKSIMSKSDMTCVTSPKHSGLSILTIILVPLLKRVILED